MNDFLRKYMGYVFIGIILIIVCFILYRIYSIIKENLNYSKKTKQIITGLSEQDQSVKITKENLKETKKKTKKKNFLVKLYRENIFFDGSKLKFFRNLIVGYVVLAVIFFILSSDILLSIIFALSWFVLFYIVVDKKNEKNRKKYIKGFSLALKTLTASVEAGNSFEEGIALIVRRESINKKIRTEFAFLSNNLKSGKSLDDALEDFWKRNSMFPEFSMFVIVMQFYAKKGGAGLGKILLQLEETLTKKVENYAEIDTELGIHKTLMNCCIYAYFIILLGIKLFKPTFYVELSNDNLGVVKALGSVFFVFIATVFFKSMVRSAAEN